MVSNIIGQGRKEEVIHVIIKIMKLSCSLAVIACLLINIFPRLFLSIYGQGEDFMELGVRVIRIVGVAMVFMSVSIIWPNAVTGTGNSKVTFLIELAAIILYCLYVYYVLEVYHLSITWGWMSEWLYWTSMFLGGFLYIKSNRWKSTVI